MPFRRSPGNAPSHAVTATHASADFLRRIRGRGLLPVEAPTGSRAARRPRAPTPHDVLQESAPTLVLLAAPPGFGKSTVLAQWRDLDDRAFACVSLDSGDNDPAALWSYIVHAIRNVAPNSGDAALSALRQPRPDVVQTVVPAVLDDVEPSERTSSSCSTTTRRSRIASCHDSLAFFLERAPRNVTVALSTRSDPPIPLARLRVLDELLEARAADLCFTEEEAAAFLNETLQLGLATETLGVLHERTEGWPVGVHLAALPRAGASIVPVSWHASAARTGTWSTTSPRSCSTRWTRRAGCSCSRRRFSTRCAGRSATLPRRGRAPRTCSSSSSTKSLPGRARRSPRVVPLPPAVRGGPPKPAASERCRARPHGAPRASKWYLANGHAFEAVRHAVAADEPETAVTLVFEGWRPSLEQEDAEASLRQLDELPWTNVEHDARLALVKAWALSVLNSREDALAALEAAEAAHSTGRCLAGSLSRPRLPSPAPASPGETPTECWAPRTAPASCKETLSRAGGRSLCSRWAGHGSSLATGSGAALLEQAAFLATRSKQWLVAGIAKALLARISLEADDVDAAVATARRAVSTLELHGVADAARRRRRLRRPGAALARGG